MENKSLKNKLAIFAGVPLHKVKRFIKQNTIAVKSFFVLKYLFY